MNFSQTSATSWRRSLFILQCNLKRSSNMVDLHDYDIELIEREILWKYNDNRRDYSDCDCLLSLRKSMINKRVLAHQEDILPDIIAFNDALRDALKDMYDRAYSIWGSIKENAWVMIWRLQPNASSPMTIQNFTPCKVKNEKNFGAQSVTAVGTHCMMMVLRCQR